jgi:hypothetical protein
MSKSIRKTSMHACNNKAVCDDITDEEYDASLAEYEAEEASRAKYDAETGELYDALPEEEKRLWQEDFFYLAIRTLDPETTKKFMRLIRCHREGRI